MRPFFRPRLALVASAVASVLAQAPAVAQEFERLAPVSDAARVAFEPVGDGDARIGKVRWTVGGGTLEIPLQVPVSHCDAALVGDDGLVILAGGNREGEDLQVYTVGAGGRQHIVPTDGGRRLPKAFADGLGSWPVADGKRLLMFAYRKRKDASVQFLAIDFGGRIHIRKSLPEDAAGFEPRFEPSSHQVRVSFGPGAEFGFAHPDAPRLELELGLLDFGTVRPGRPARRHVRVRNEGRSTAEIRGATDRPEFSLEGPGEWRVPPAGSVDLELSFDPTAVGATQGRLDLSTNTPEGALTVVLRGRRDPDPEPAATEPETPEAAPALEPPRAPQLGGVEAVGLGPGRFQLRGAVVGVDDPAREVPMFLLFESEDGRDLARADVREGRGFQVEVEAAAGSLVLARVVGASGVPSAASPAVRLGPTLEHGGERAIVRGRPRAAFRVAVVVDVGGREVELVDWAGELDANGRGELPFEALGERRAGLLLRAWQRSAAGVWIPTNALRVP